METIAEIKGDIKKYKLQFILCISFILALILMFPIARLMDCNFSLEWFDPQNHYSTWDILTRFVYEYLGYGG